MFDATRFVERNVSINVVLQSGAFFASIPLPLSLGEEKAIIHDHYARRMDRMER